MSVFYVLLLFITLITCVIGAFWVVYLLDYCIFSWRCYKRSIKVLREDETDSQQAQVVYDKKTELVKNILLFTINNVECACLIFYVSAILYMNSQRDNSDVSGDHFNSTEYALISPPAIYDEDGLQFNDFNLCTDFKFVSILDS